MEYNYKKLTEKEIAEAIEKNDTVFMEVDGTVRRVSIDDLVDASSLRTDFENGVQSESDFTVDADVGYGEGSVISDEWSISKVYQTGDYCIYNNCLYRCKVQNVNVTPANTTYWESVLVCDEISRLSGSVDILNSNLVNNIDYWNIVDETTVTTSITQYSTLHDRNFSSYSKSMLLFVMRNSSRHIIATSVVPLELFALGTLITLAYPTNSDRLCIDFQYIDDTTVTMCSNTSNDIKGQIYGFVLGKV